MIRALGHFRRTVLGTGAGDEDSVTDKGLAGIAKSISEGLDGVLNLASKVAIVEAAEMFRSTKYAEIYGRGSLPQSWKKQSMVLLPKLGKPLDDPSVGMHSKIHRGYRWSLE